MRTTVTGEELKQQDACKDNEGFFVRSCPRCLKQKPLTPELAALYGQPVGAKAQLPSFAPNDERRLRGERRD